MNIAEKLDLAIKLKEKGTTGGAYAVTHNGKTLSKATYMTNEEWKVFEDAMKKNKLQPSAHTEYGEGGGGELSEKCGRPPKMASFGSSSRMIYTLSSQKEGFHYEKKLSTTVGGQANLDGFYEDEARYIFVEAKCHEPYAKKSGSVSTAYEKLYQRINGAMMGNVSIKSDIIDGERNMNVEYFADEERLEHFDLKQMICHLLGIATGLLNKTLKNKQIDFVYLLYDPTELEISPDAKAKIDAIYERTCYECNLIDFSELFRAILEFLIETKFQEAMSSEEVDDMVLKFTFTLASQDFYPILIQ